MKMMLLRMAARSEVLRAFGPKFLDHFLKLGMSVAQSAKLRTAIFQSVARGNALHVAAQVLSYLLHRREIMVSGFLAIGQGPAAASDQNTQRHGGSEFHSTEA
jgi:hypothetical protein